MSTWMPLSPCIWVSIRIEVQGKLHYTKIVFCYIFCFHLHGVSVTTKLAMLIFGATYLVSSILVKHISCISKYCLYYSRMNKIQCCNILCRGWPILCWLLVMSLSSPSFFRICIFIFLSNEYMYNMQLYLFVFLEQWTCIAIYCPDDTLAGGYCFL